MDKGKELRAALAVMGAVAGTGYASGRELVLFFAQLGRASWVGIGFAAVVFALLTALLCRWAGTSGATGFAGACRQLLGPRTGGVAGAMSTLAAASMLAFSLLYTPCVAAVASIKRELGGRWALGVVLGQCAVAWVAALLVRVAGLLLGLG